MKQFTSKIAQTFKSDQYILFVSGCFFAVNLLFISLMTLFTLERLLSLCHSPTPLNFVQTM